MEILKTFNNGLKLAIYKEKYCITDDWLTDWLIFYGKSKQGINLGWAHEGIFNLTGKESREIRIALDKLSIKLIRGGHEK